jgi:hypothetical protein
MLLAIKLSVMSEAIVPTKEVLYHPILLSILGFVK